MKNEDVVYRFSMGATEGQAGHLTIIKDTLYSYAMPIAKRKPNGDGFLVSNAMRALGGTPVSQTTSCHIGLAHRYCQPNTLVNVVS